MPFALLLLGLIMIVSGARDTYKELGEELTADFTGPNNFTYWILAFGGVGMLGYVPQLRTFSRTFMALIIIGMLLANQNKSGGGFFAQFMAAIQQGPQAPASAATTAPANVTTPGQLDPGSFFNFIR